MVLEEVLKVVEEYYPKVEKKYGYSKFHLCTPYLEFETKKSDVCGVYDSIDNTITIYTSRIESKQQLLETLIHEYQHYLQSPSWYKRYYTLGHTYMTHPYELAARKEELNWNTL